jgi:hypothetical protein
VARCVVFLFSALALYLITIKLKRAVKVSSISAVSLVCVLLLVLSINFALNSRSTDFSFTPRSWKFSVGKLEVLAINKTNGVAESHTNRVSHLGPIVIRDIITE